MYIYVWIYENGVEKFNSRPKRAFFFFCKVDDIKIKSKVSTFFLPLPVYFPFIALLSLLFAHLQGLRKALKFSEIKVQLNSRPKRAFFSRLEKASLAHWCSLVPK